MANPRQIRNSIFRLILGAAMAALTIAFMLIVVAPPPAQAQTYKKIHNFTGGQDGGTPYAGVTLDRGRKSNSMERQLAAASVTARFTS